MKTSKLYIYLLIITVLIININAHIIPVYQYKKIIKRDDTTTDNTNDTGDNQNVTQPDNNQDTPPDNSAQTTKAPEVTPQPQVVPTTTQPQSQPTPTTEKTPEKTPDKTPEDETKNQETIGIKTATKDSETKTSGINSTSTNKSDNNNKNNNNNNNNNNNKSNDNEDDDDGLSGGTIALIVVGGIFALGVVIIIFRSLLKLCTKKSKDYPTPVLNVVSNQESSEQLNPQMKISQDPMLESGYYNQSTSTIPATGTVVGVNDKSQYYPPQQPMYDNGGVDISNKYQQDMNNQYQQDEYQNGYTDDYPVQPQSEVVQPIRNFSSLRRQNLTSGMPEMPLEGYDNPSMMNGEITDVPQAPHKVIINKTNNTPIEPNTIHKAQFPFNPNMSDELKLNTGDAVEIIEVYDDGWSYGKNMATNEIGVFPISYITGYNDPSNNF